MSVQQFPNDKSTVFSIVPFALNEFKPGIYPGFFTIPACLDDREPQRLVVGSSEHLIAIAGRKQPARITQASFEIARSLVVDFLDGQLFSTPDAHPGISWMQGDVPTETFKNVHEDIYQEMRDFQRRWFVLIVNKTQDDWNKYKNSRVVSDQARFAVRALGLEIPEWMSNETIGLQFNKCPACSTMNDPENAVCTNCRCVLNEDKFKKLTFAK